MIRTEHGRPPTRNEYAPDPVANLCAALKAHGSQPSGDAEAAAAPGDPDPQDRESPEFEFGDPDDLLGQAEAHPPPPSHHQTLLAEGAVVEVAFQRSSFAVRTVAGTPKLSGMMLILDGDLAGRPLFYGRNPPSRAGWLNPSCFLALDWAAVMPPAVRLPPVPKFDPRPATRDKKGRARLRRVGRALLDEMFTGADGNSVILRVSTTQVTGFHDSKPGQRGQWVQRPEHLWYSRVDRILSRVAGWPRGAERQRRRGAD